MTQENKELLLKNICARLPYGVIVHTPEGDMEFELCSMYTETVQGYPYEMVKPYLRPMSSITEEEKEELKEICSIYIPTDSKNISFEDYGILVFTHHLTDNSYSFKLNLNVIDWLNAHHFDYRNLIERGLAIEVTEENNPYKE